MKTLRHYVLCLLLMFFTAAPLAAFELQDLEKTLQQPAAVQGAFVQKRHLKSLPDPLISHGQFVLVPRKALLWKMEKPFANRLRVSARGVEQYSDATRRWVKGNQTANQVKLFLSLLGGDTAGLRDSFDITLHGKAQDWRMVLHPRDALLQQIFTRIELTGGQTVRSIVLYEKQGDRNEMLFERVQLNPELNAQDTDDLRF
ncbi:MAG: outer membrane lipoprotein carrier protein LolA [Neisseria sp.]|nr:outer membrane lipoprotein carrier protein LolA [Neisseria sp.]